jgi:LPPG:FO 2-phospho-L-lactate transferase
LTEEGAVSFHEYFTQLACEPPVHGFQYAGAAEARLSDEVLDALHSTTLEAVVIGPANPYHTIRPILEVGGMRELLRKRGAPVIAVTPIVGGKAVKGSAGKMMRELGREPSALAAAGEYLRVIDGFVIDSEDAHLAGSVRSLGIQVLVAQTVMRTDEMRLSLARTVLGFARDIRETRVLEVGS